VLCSDQVSALRNLHSESRCDVPRRFARWTEGDSGTLGEHDWWQLCGECGHFGVRDNLHVLGQVDSLLGNDLLSIWES
jgi:hypothetical protein